MSETGQCGKCSSEINTEADRCPECGYEPSKLGIILGLLGFVAFNVFLFGLLIAIITPFLLLDGELSLAIFTLVIFGGVAGVAGLFLYALYQKTQLTPVNNEISYNVGN